MDEKLTELLKLRDELERLNQMIALIPKMKGNCLRVDFEVIDSSNNTFSQMMVTGFCENVILLALTSERDIIRSRINTATEELKNLLK